jgi:fluoride exporter
MCRWSWWTTSVNDRIGRRRAANSPVDSDVDFHFQRQVRELAESPVALPAAVALGGALVALCRYGVDRALPYEFGEFAVATLLVNISGCLLIGFLMVLVIEVRPQWRLVRPFVGVGVLGGYTTFSTQIVDAQHLLVGGAPGATLGYLGATLGGALIAVWCGIVLAERVFRRAIRATASQAAGTP